MRLFVLAARFKRPSLAKPRTDEATGAERSNLFRERNHGAKSFRIRPRQLRRAERRQTHCRDARTQAARGTRHGVRRLAPPSACGRARLPAFHLRFSPTGLSSRGLSFGPGFPKTALKRGLCRLRCHRSQRCTSRAGRIAGRHDARAARVRTVSFRPRGAALAPPSGSTLVRRRPLSEIGGGYPYLRREVKSV
jgi:hypothetical protein